MGTELTGGGTEIFRIETDLTGTETLMMRIETDTIVADTGFTAPDAGIIADAKARTLTDSMGVSCFEWNCAGGLRAVDGKSERLNGASRRRGCERDLAISRVVKLGARAETAAAASVPERPLLWISCPG